MKRIVLTLVVLATASMQAGAGFDPFKEFGKAPGIPTGVPGGIPTGPADFAKGLGGLGQGIAGMSEPQLALALGISVVQLRQMCKQNQSIKIGENANGPVYANVSALQACSQNATATGSASPSAKN